ncbi:hypothetical protein, partial [Hymenobacter rubidus]|uniref:hypothetical protein n=1 Tax=Hymenobacter rubidus TaxID=1441626 RepID=UPI001F2441A6
MVARAAGGALRLKQVLVLNQPDNQAILFDIGSCRVGFGKFRPFRAGFKLVYVVATMAKPVFSVLFAYP